MELVSYEYAKANGLKRFYTGVSCKHGHVSERQTSNKSCCACLRAASVKYQKTEKGHKNKIKQDNLYYKRHKSKLLDNLKQFRADNPNLVRGWKRKEYQKNKAAYVARARNREKHIKLATPPWFSEWDEFLHLMLHEKRIELNKLTGVTWHIDHVVPLQGEFVSGLHCSSNWRLIQASENLSKSNKFEMDV